uniref:Putative secreted protein n=1 Tax=Rhipicephalus microplus TaxID=6941 RepID=A0A6M2DD25_RHIMP
MFPRGALTIPFVRFQPIGAIAWLGKHCFFARFKPSSACSVCVFRCHFQFIASRIMWFRFASHYHVISLPH